MIYTRKFTVSFREYSRAHHVTLYTVFVCRYAQFDILPFLYVLVNVGAYCDLNTKIEGDSVLRTYAMTATRCVVNDIQIEQDSRGRAVCTRSNTR